MKKMDALHSEPFWASECLNPPSFADSEQQSSQPKKVPYAKPIPKSFQQSWNEVGALAVNVDPQQPNFAQPPGFPQGGGGGPPGGMMHPPGPDCIPLQGLLVHISHTQCGH